MKDNGKMINSMDKEQNHGNFIKLGIVDNFCGGRKLAKEGLSLRAAFMKGILLMDNFMDKASITLGRVAKFMKVSFLIIIWKVRGL